LYSTVYILLLLFIYRNHPQYEHPSGYTYNNPTYASNFANQQQKNQENYFSAGSKDKGDETIKEQ